MSPEGELLNGQCMRRCRFFLSERGGSKPNGEKTALIFLCLFWGFLVQKIPGMRGGVHPFTRGLVQMLISIEFDRTCDLPGMGSGPPTPPPLPLDLHMRDI